ncbi:MAG: MFS transporter, partial [Ktedonobacterales bacterium]
SVGFGAVLYAASIAANDGWTAHQVLLWFAIGGAGLVAFTLIELFVAKDPLLNLRLLRKPIFLLGTLVGYVSVLALFGAEFLLPLYLQSLRGKTALETGFILLPLALTSGVIAPISGKLYDKIGARPLMVAGFGMLLLNTWQFAQLDATTPIGWILLLLAIRGVALGLTVQTTLVISLSVITRQEVANASSLSNATRQVVQSIGVAVLATVLATTLSPAVKAFEAQARSAPIAVTSSASSFGICDYQSVHVPTSAANVPPTGAPAASGIPPSVLSLLHEACSQSLQGFDNAYTLTFYFARAALLLGATLPGWPGKWGGRESPDAHAESELEGASETVAAL